MELYLTMINNKYPQKIQGFNFNYFKNRLEEVNLTGKLLVLFSSIFFIILTIFKNYDEVLGYFQQNKEFELLKKSLKYKSKILKDLQVKNQGLFKKNIKLFDEGEKTTWEELIKLYSITLSKRLKLENKTIISIESFDNTPNFYSNTAFLEVKINETLIPINMQIEIALFLAQFGDIKKYDKGIFKIYVIKNKKG